MNPNYDRQVEWRKMRDLGRPARITAAEIELCKAHVRLLAQAGMTSSAINRRIEASGGGYRFVEWAREPGGRGMNRTTYDKLMAIPVKIEARDFPGKHGGPRTDPTGSRRKLQALAARGFAFTWMAEQMNTVPPVVVKIVHDDVARISRKTHAKVSALYRAYHDKDPAPVSVHQHAAITQQKMRASRKGWAPPTAWDDDTIDNPATIAQWTGKCGMPSGPRVHEEHGIPLCGPCRIVQKRTEQ